MCFVLAGSGRYLLVAQCVTCFYSLLTALTSLKLISGSSPTKTLFLLVLLDVVSSTDHTLYSLLQINNKLEQYILLYFLLEGVIHY
jgi:hypothetical protein